MKQTLAANCEAAVLLLLTTHRDGIIFPTGRCCLSRNVERMRAHGWLEAVSGEDARTQPFRLTAKGRRLLERAGAGLATGAEKGE